jgi:hypothetical protein
VLLLPLFINNNFVRNNNMAYNIAATVKCSKCRTTVKLKVGNQFTQLIQLMMRATTGSDDQEVHVYSLLEMLTGIIPKHWKEAELEGGTPISKDSFAARAGKPSPSAAGAAAAAAKVQDEPFYWAHPTEPHIFKPHFFCNKVCVDNFDLSQDKLLGCTLEQLRVGAVNWSSKFLPEAISRLVANFYRAFNGLDPRPSSPGAISPYFANFQFAPGVRDPQVAIKFADDIVTYFLSVERMEAAVASHMMKGMDINQVRSTAVGNRLWNHWGDKAQEEFRKIQNSIVFVNPIPVKAPTPLLHAPAPHHTPSPPPPPPPPPGEVSRPISPAENCRIQIGGAVAYAEAPGMHRILEDNMVVQRLVQSELAKRPPVAPVIEYRDRDVFRDLTPEQITQRVLQRLNLINVGWNNPAPLTSDGEIIQVIREIIAKDRFQTLNMDEGTGLLDGRPRPPRGVPCHKKQVNWLYLLLAIIAMIVFLILWLLCRSSSSSSNGGSCPTVSPCDTVYIPNCGVIPVSEIVGSVCNQLEIFAKAAANVQSLGGKVMGDLFKHMGCFNFASPAMPAGYVIPQQNEMLQCVAAIPGAAADAVRAVWSNSQASLSDGFNTMMALARNMTNPDLG